MMLISVPLNSFRSYGVIMTGYCSPKSVPFSLLVTPSLFSPPLAQVLLSVPKKPSPIIFNAALLAQGVTAAESIYVDDTKEEADGAIELGFTSFLISRSNEEKANSK